VPSSFHENREIDKTIHLDPEPLGSDTPPRSETMLSRWRDEHNDGEESASSVDEQIRFVGIFSSVRS
jgi:hypothetical protein